MPHQKAGKVTKLNPDLHIIDGIVVGLVDRLHWQSELPGRCRVFGSINLYSGTMETSISYQYTFPGWKRHVFRSSEELLYQLTDPKAALISYSGLKKTCPPWSDVSNPESSIDCAKSLQGKHHMVVQYIARWMSPAPQPGLLAWITPLPGPPSLCVRRLYKAVQQGRGRHSATEFKVKTQGDYNFSVYFLLSFLFFVCFVACSHSLFTFH